jgi:hypothetical protein
VKPKTRKNRELRNFPLADAISKQCSEKGFSLLQWGFQTPTGFPKHSSQLPTDVVNQILSWRDLEINIRMAGG